MKVTNAVLRSCLLLALAQLACSDSGDSKLPCGAGTERIDGRCESTLVCGDGTVLQDNQCLPSSGSACGEGTRIEDGACVPDTETVCGAGTTPIDGVCVNQNVIVCGAGTEASGGECLPTEVLECGIGTEEVTDDDGDVTCEPRCDAPEIWDTTAGDCVTECGPGTVFSGDAGVCEFACEADEFYDGGSDTCLTVPICGRNTAAGEEDCEGWPWHELSLETLCARRAHYICDNLIDCCGDGGMFYSGDPLNNGTIGYDIIDTTGSTTIDVSTGDEAVPLGRVRAGWTLDHSGCLAIETVRCEMTDIALYRHLVDQGQATVNATALEQFDEYFSRESTECTLPTGWVDWKTELQHALIDGTTALESECLSSEQCGTGAYCEFVEYDELYNPVYKCLARGAAGDECYFRSPQNYFLNSTSVSSCQDGLECIGENCLTPLDLGDNCMAHYQAGRQWWYETPVCRGDTICRPTDPIALADDPVCRHYLAENAQCRPPSATQSGLLDWCGPGLWCDDDAYVNAEMEYNGNIGLCVTAAVDGSECDFCMERGYFGFGARSVFADRCEDDSDCSAVENLDSDSGYDQACAGSESVCLYRYNFFPPVCN